MKARRAIRNHLSQISKSFKNLRSLSKREKWSTHRKRKLRKCIKTFTTSWWRSRTHKTVLIASFPDSNPINSKLSKMGGIRYKTEMIKSTRRTWDSRTRKRLKDWCKRRRRRSLIFSRMPSSLRKLIKTKSWKSVHLVRGFRRLLLLKDWTSSWVKGLVRDSKRLKSSF